MSAISADLSKIENSLFLSNFSAFFTQKYTAYAAKFDFSIY